MSDAERQTRSHLVELFEQQGFRPRTDLGQNFLIDLNLLEYVVEQANLGPDDVVLEVGAGTGGMTTFLARSAAAVVSVEVDRRIIEITRQSVAPYANVTLLHQDALKNKNRIAAEVVEAVEAQLAEAPGRRLKLVANLPYSIATPIVSNLVASDLPWERMVVTIQWELGARMTAKPGTSDYSALSVWLQSQCRVKILKRLPPSVFWPRPKVNSAIVRLFPDPPRRKQIHDRAFFQDFVRQVFTQRRKFLRSVLVSMYRKEIAKDEIDRMLTELHLGEKVRAEELEPEVLVEISNCIRGLTGRPSTEY
jgi:16S rRNA (adenine1518-N6/adenine1519-N6)-dimethyltransferase